jgi:adenylate cyclase
VSALRRLSVNWLVPRRRGPGARIARRTALILFVLLSVANTIGAVIVFALASWVLPPPDVTDPAEVQILNLVVAVSYVLAATVVGTVWSLRRLRPVYGWLRSEREPTAADRDAVLRAPWRIVSLHVWLWFAAAILFGILNWTYSGELGRRVALTVALGGTTTCAIVYLFTERGLRAAAARALRAGPPDRLRGPGVRGRALLGWALGGGVPLVGLIAAGLSALIDDDYSLDDLAITVIALSALALIAGFFVSRLAARAVADPIGEVRQALAEVEEGDLDIEVPVYDGSEVGQLQAGFNSMVVGLRERARIQDLFGRHVGEDVARAALEQGIELGGETREVAVLFTDVVGSTRLASELPPQEVVDRLNSFFSVVIGIVDRHGGSVNKFEGDAVLAIFGAPDTLGDPAAAALAAARELSERLTDRVEGIEAGIGVSAGEVVAGNIGGESRFEYTVIGDAVNEASRLTELAKDRPGRVLASEAAVQSAGEEEAGRWELGESVELRGRDRPTRLAAPGADAGN